MPHPDLAAEQAHLDRSYGRLEAVRAETEAQLREAFAERGGTFQSYTERDIRVRNSLSRLDKLQLGRESLIFGRIDRSSDGTAASQESFHIGRIAVSDRDHEPLVVDWRAPVAEPFYRATGAHPMGLRLRRHFLTEGRRVLDLEDELFGPDNPDGTAGPLVLSGPSVLMAALERAHTGRMRDIVATVQAEQDEIIRAPLPGALVVQGGPGTGKTAVALHRAAYLLYTHRFPLESQGVLVIGPNPTFLRYIDQVLPSLGETGAELSTISNLYRAARPSSAEPAEVARLKGDARMAVFLRRAVRQRQRPLRKAAQIAYGRGFLTLSPEASQEIIVSARRRAGTHNSRRRFVESLLWQHFAGQLEKRLEGRAGVAISPLDEPGLPGHDVSPAELGAELRRRPEVGDVLERIWPRLSPEDFLHDLLGARPLIEHAGRGVLPAEELALLQRPRSASAELVEWSAADIALLDEASWLLGPMRSGGGSHERQRAYGHIVVDEAQDLTPMELRMVARRSLSGSMTLVGDIAQATGAWAPASWDEVLAHLPKKRGWARATLSVSYRAPAEVMALAVRVLAEAVPGTEPPTPVRHTGHEPLLVLAPGDLGAAVAGAVAAEVAAVASQGGDQDGSVGVLVPPELVAEVRSGLVAAGLSFGEVGAGALDAQVSLLAVTDAKGLEFDSVIVVEPAAVVASAAQGLRALYVALTRCTRRLAVVYSKPLPGPLRSRATS
ncbi:MAG TPA: AAA family ATPase [Acidimicrobiales bacterium]|nr:AAA family ATPase [Acidimicrobiales bacterium]